ncbi:hypothetical protein H072_6409 [Dactylellina haptotyla CBS 200.50]|uniref:Uncharacterized protein n=1 Tax=Dactylellina haptotyla (strain CBS 200.50) TaxID=1284197 RepID=S8AAE7_DACHA|nr:hypothetical protein H072_6409 [Dactylellina haptotyla CBS 200.50]
MTSPKTLDFPLPPRRASNPSDLRSPPLAPFTNFAPVAPAQQQLSRILELTNRYRTQTVALLARQEALAAEQKSVFELERQLWNTEREIWEEERRLLTGGGAPNGAAVVNGDRITNLDAAFSAHPPTPVQLNNTTRFLSVSSMAESTGTAEPNAVPASLQHPPPPPEPVAAAAPTSRRRDSLNGGLRLNWYMKQGTTSDRIPGIPNESVSPKGTRSNGRKIDSPRYAPPGDPGLPRQIISEDINEDREGSAGENEDDFEISSALLSEATKLVYGDKATFGGNSAAAKRQIPALFKTMSDTSDTKSIRRASSSIYPSSMRNARYLNSFSDDGSEEDDVYEVSKMPRLGQKVRKRSASQTDKPNDIPLRLRPSSNFGAAFGAISTKGQQTLAPPPPPRQGSISSSTFYHPETPVDSFNSQHSFRDASWAANSGTGNTSKLPENSLGADSLQSSRTIKPTVDPINVKSTPWGVTSTNINSSPTFGNNEASMQQAQQGGLKPSPSGLTSSLSISSSQNSPVGKVPIPTTASSDKFSTTSSRYSGESISIAMHANHHHHHQNGHSQNYHNNKQYLHKTPSSSSSANNNNGEQQKGKTSPPTYTWTPPPPLPTSPTMSTTSSRKSGMYGNAILLSPSTIAPSMKTTNPRLSAVGGILPIAGLSSPPLGRMGTSSMLLSVSSRSEGGDDLDDDDDELEEHEVEIETDEEDDVVEIAGKKLSSNGMSKASGKKVMGYNEPPVEIVRDNGRWGGVLPGGMI